MRKEVLILAQPIFLKIGGSLLSSGDSLHRIGDTVAALAESFPLVIVPGGGAFADLVRFYGEKIPLREETCHFMALLAMDQYAYILQEMIPHSHILNLNFALRSTFPSPITSPSPFKTTEDPAFSPEPAELFPIGSVHILHTSDYLHNVPASVLPRSWEVTSDTIAAYLAGCCQTQLLVLLKAKDPSPEAVPPDVDPCFRKMIPAALPIWLLNGHHPERLNQLLVTGQTQGVPLGPSWKGYHHAVY